MSIYFIAWIFFTVFIYIGTENGILINPRVKRLIVVFTGIVYIIFSVFRNTSWNPNIDIYHYRIYFEGANVPLLTYIRLSTFEIGYTLLEWIIYHMFRDFRVLLFVTHSLVYISKIKLLRNLRIRKYYFVLVALMALDLFTAFYLVRHTIAISISIFVYLKLMKREYVKAVVLSFLAISIHNAAVILLFICMACYLFNNRKRISKYKLSFYGILAVAGAYVIAPIICLYFASDDKYFVYVGNGAVGVRFYSTALITWILAIGNLKRKKDEVYQMATISLTCLFVLFPLQLFIGIIYRMTLFFEPLIYYLLVKLPEFYNRRDVRYIGIRVLGYLTLGISLYQFFTGSVEYIGNPYKWAGF